ncbi:hypothetical protein B5X24_HaOG213167 [Helicoverpa armigera]|uniref:DDE Tnp4 domain-containing protein n=1 Tax=Helicoverpa armigera TaxID=29058 RepID=A0A2W1BIQ1_HELAM|nr:hypothetical protein B5X24_HaOG213167 [Helicoverpa armigera]
MRLLFQNENSELRQYFRQNDVFILDRGFRDSFPLLTPLGYTVCKPETLSAGKTQLSTEKANKSRLVTLCSAIITKMAKARKRQRNTDQWKRNLQKLERDEGTGQP